MVLCTRCKKNVAVLFITKIEQGKTVNEGLCLSCAKELGITDVTQIAKSMGIPPEELPELEESMNEAMSMLSEQGDDDDNPENPLGNLMSIFGGKSKEKPSDDEEKSPKKKKGDKKKKMLNSYAENLTQKARDGKVDRVIGRDAEITRCIEILNRRSKNNPCLIGEPGVGKTAIAEGLAVRITEGNVPAKLLDREIYLLDFTAIVAGTQFRGQFESRLKNIIEEVKTAGNIILVIDELHNIVGAGEAEGAMNAANILKPALARGEIQVIGATTTTEYRKFIEKDAALERRFQTISVEEPTIEQTVEIIMGIKEYYEEYHNVIISENVARSAAVLSERYINDRFLPDKAIDVIDEAASRANLQNVNIAELAKAEAELSSLRNEITELSEQPSEEDYSRLAELKTRECRLAERVSTLKEETKSTHLTTEDIAGVIERWTKIPARQISREHTGKLLELEDIMKKRVKGQDHAIDAVSAAIRRGRAGLSKKKRPVSFIFAGQTGVGKTETVLALAEAVFGSEDALIRLDMSEYMEKHAVSKIIGSPPGYLGYDDAGQLTEKVRRRPYSVILFDEIEKAHAEVLNILLQILDDGRITDSHGKHISFENTVIIMTTNAGSEYKGGSLGYTADNKTASEQKVNNALKEIFRPEFLNRVDETVVFNPLNTDILMEILKKLVSEFAEKLAEKEINFEITPDAMQVLLQKGTDLKNGARPLRRVIQKELEDKTAYLIISEEIKAKETLKASVSRGEIVLSVM